MRARPESLPRRRPRWIRLVGANAGFLVGAAFGAAAMGAFTRLGPESLESDLAHYREVRDFARNSFVRQLDADALLDRALEGMLTSLDEHSRYYDEADAKGLDRETIGRYTGIGVVLRRPLEEGRVHFALAGSPAERAGLRVGDRIVKIGRQEIAPGNFRSELLHESPAEEGLALEVVGLDGERRRLVVERTSLVDPTVRHASMIDEAEGIAYLSIHSFSRTTAGEFDQALARLRADGARGLILDLRGNFGGVLLAAVEIAGRFIAEGTIVSTEGQGAPEVYAAGRALATSHGMPLVVLVDGNSASASEVLAAALQDHRVAVVVGSPTYGKGLVQSIRRFPERGTIAKVTSAYYYTPSRRNLERSLDPERDWGIRPDLDVSISRNERARVYEHLASYDPPPSALAAMRAWEEASGEAVVPRHPQDTQLDAALALLRGERPGPVPIDEGQGS